MLSLTTLASGSSGNCTLVSDGRTHILVDAGISARRITAALCAFGLDPARLSGILITHEHSDHIAGLSVLSRRHRIPVYASGGTGRQLCYRMAALEDVLSPFSPGDAFAVGDLLVSSFSTPHDAAESVGFTLSNGTHKAAVVTDLGTVTDEVRAAVKGCDILAAETNHDARRLADGPYPYFLKARILGERGHLSNEAGAELAVFAVSRGARAVILSHLSSENNTPRLAYDAVSAALEAAGARAGADLSLLVAPRSEPGRPVCVGEGAVAAL